MKRLLAILVVLSSMTLGVRAQTPPVIGPANIANTLYAANFAGWTAPPGQNGPFSWSSAQICTSQTSGGVTFKPFVVGSPIRINDQATPTHSENVTVTAVNIIGSGCSITTTTPAFQHYSFFLSSATGGLQEALNYSKQTFGTTNPASIVIVSPAFIGTTGMITSALGNAAISILDERQACLVAYTWSGSAYVGQSLCGGGGSGPIVEINSAPISPSSPANFVDTASVTWAFVSGQIRATATGGGTGCGAGTIYEFCWFNGTTWVANPNLTDNNTQINYTPTVPAADHWFRLLEGSAVSGATNYDYLAPIASIHRWEQLLNNGAATVIPGTSPTPATAGDCVIYGSNGWDIADSGNPSCGSSLVMDVVPPVGGQYVVIYPKNITTTNSGSVTAFDNRLTSSSYCAFGGAGEIDETGFTLPSNVLPANVTAVYAFAFSANYPLGGVGTCFSSPLTPNTFVLSTFQAQATGASPVGLQPTVNPDNSWLFQQSTSSLFGVTGANIPSTAIVAHGIVGGDFKLGAEFDLPLVGLIVYYTGSAPPASTAIHIDPCLTFSNSTLGLSPTCQFPGKYLLPYTIAQATPLAASSLPASIFFITDGTTATDCTTGGGGHGVFCEWSGTTLVPFTPGTPTTAFSALTSGTNTTAAMLVGSGASLGVTGSGTINATNLETKTWEVPGTIGSTTPNTGVFSTLTDSALTSGNCVQASTAGLLTTTGSPCGAGGGGSLPSASFAGQIIASTAAGTTYGNQAQIFYSQSSDTITTIESECSSLCTYVVTIPQTMTLAADHTLASNVQLDFRAGGKWTLAGGHTLTIPGNVSGTLNQHFAGSTLVFQGLQTLVPVEWFGAVGDWNGTTGTDNTTTVQACLNSLTAGQCVLQAVSYKITAALTIAKSNVGMAGVAPASFGGEGAALIVTAASVDAIEVGTFHGSYITRNTFSNFSIYRTVLPTGTASGITFNDVGVPTVRGVNVADSLRGFYFLGGNNAEISNSLVSIGAVGGYSTAVYGYYVDSDSSSPENSIHFSNIIGVDTGATNHFVGFELHGPRINDVDVDFLNVAGEDYGVRIDFTGSCPTTNAYDIQFKNATLDNPHTDTIFATGVCSSGNGTVATFNGGWFNGPIDIESSSGISIANSQIAEASLASLMLVNNSNAIDFTNDQFYWGTYLHYAGSSSGVISGNTFRSPASTAPTTFITLTGSSRNVVTGNALSGYATNGITLDASSNNNVLDDNAIDPTNITTPLTDSGSGNGAGNNGAVKGTSGVFVTSLSVAGNNVCQSTGTNCPASTPAFSSVGSGTNTTAAMVVGAGASLAPASTGTIQATNIANTVAATAPIVLSGSGTTSSPYSFGCPSCGTGTGGSNVSQNSGSTETNLPITGHMPQVCSDTSGSGTAQVCTVANSFIPQTGNCLVYQTTTANSGTGLTINVDSLGAKSVAVAGPSGWTTTLVASSSIPANKPMNICYDGTHWNASGTGFASANPTSLVIVGTASFSLNGGSVGNLHMSGIVSGVVRNSTGNYTVSFSPSAPSNYIIACNAGTTGVAFTGCGIETTLPLSTSSVPMSTWGGSTNVAQDAKVVSITIIAP